MRLSHLVRSESTGAHSQTVIDFEFNVSNQSIGIHCQPMKRATFFGAADLSVESEEKSEENRRLFLAAAGGSCSTMRDER